MRFSIKKFELDEGNITIVTNDAKKETDHTFRANAEQMCNFQKWMERQGGKIKDILEEKGFRGVKNEKPVEADDDDEIDETIYEQ